MTRSNPDTQQSLDKDADQQDVGQRCLLYLLGELRGDAATEFEQQLGQSERLQTELLAQSEIICALDTDNTPTLVTTSQSVWQSVAAAMVALAACLTVAFLNWSPEQENHANQTTAVSQPAEGLLIAQAWADVSLTSEAMDATVEPDEFLETETESDDDSSLSWMVAAVKAGATSDG